MLKPDEGPQKKRQRTGQVEGPGEIPPEPSESISKKGAKGAKGGRRRRVDSKASSAAKRRGLRSSGVPETPQDVSPIRKLSPPSLQFRHSLPHS